MTDYTGEDRAVKLDLQLSKFVDELRNMDERKAPFSKEQLLYFAERFDKHIFQISVILVPGIVRNTNNPNEIGMFFAVERFFDGWRSEIEVIKNNWDTIEAYKTFTHVYNLLAQIAFRSAEFLILIDAHDRMNAVDQTVLGKYKLDDKVSTQNS